MNGYVCFYRGRKMEIQAATAYDAQQKAARAFSAKRGYQVAVVLAEKAGEQVAHDPAMLG